MTFVRGLAKMFRPPQPSRGIPLVSTLTVGVDAYPDRAVLSQACELARCDLQVASSCEDACHLASRLRAPVILYDRDIQETEWRAAVGVLSALPHRPLVILISRVADEYLWNELFRIGGFDVLRKPLRAEDVSRTLNLALSYWRSEAAG